MQDYKSVVLFMCVYFLTCNGSSTERYLAAVTPNSGIGNFGSLSWNRNVSPPLGSTGKFDFFGDNGTVISMNW